MMTLTIFLILVVTLLILRELFLSFRSQSPVDYKGLGPDFDPKVHLNGPLLCEGVLFGPAGRVASRFSAKMDGVWQGGSGKLTELFTYDSGRVQNREWNLQLTEGGGLVGLASDVVGQGKGEVTGPGIRMRYRLRLPVEAGGHVLDVVDWMYLVPGGTIVNRSQFRKFGFTVAELVATIRPVAASQ